MLKAAAFAAHKHRHQRCKDGDATPYINHPIAVARVLSGEGAVRDPDILASPRADGTLACKREYFDWAKRVVDQIRDVSPELAEKFDQLYAQRPAT